MISVCITTYNGSKFIEQQLNSIVKQLSDNDEIIISDDDSKDNTVNIIQSYSSPIIKLYKNKFHNHILNFEFVLSKASGDYIFMSDQDDVWLEDKVKIMMQKLEKYDLVCSNCIVTNKDLIPDGRLFMTEDASQISGFFKNLVHNHYLGCCMAFNRAIRDKAIPFPKGLITHDTWIGLIAEVFGKPTFINDKLIYFRRHDSNTSNTLNKSNLSLRTKISYRITIIKGIIKRLF